MEAQCKAEVISHNVSANGNELILVWADDENHESVFHAQWLRFRCECNDCHPGRIPGCWKNRIREFSDDLRINNATIEEKGNILRLDFDNELLPGHVTRHELKWLRSHCYCNSCLKQKLAKSDVISCHNNAVDKKERTIPEVDWLDYENDKDNWTFKWMDYIFKAGMCFVKNAPSGEELKKDRDSPDAVFDYLSNKNKGEAIENVGTQTGSMGMHQDYPYHPQLFNHISLHKCISFDDCIEGGWSVLVDGFEAAEVLKSESPQHFKALSEIPVIFQYTDEQGKTWCLQKTNIVVDYYGKVTAVNWNGDYSPEIQVKGCDVDRYYDAYKAFSAIVESRKEMRYRFKHSPGTMFCFNNVRMIHKREGFIANGGLRRIVCISVNNVNMKANYIGLAKKLGIKVSLPKIGNGSSF